MIKKEKEDEKTLNILPRKSTGIMDVFSIMISFRPDNDRGCVRFKTYQILRGDPSALRQPGFVTPSESMIDRIVDILTDAENQRGLYYHQPPQQWILTQFYYDDRLDELMCYLHPIKKA